MSGLAVTALMITYTPFAVISKPTTTMEWKTYLKGGKVWFAIKEYVVKFYYLSKQLTNIQVIDQSKSAYCFARSNFGG